MHGESYIPGKVPVQGRWMSHTCLAHAGIRTRHACLTYQAQGACAAFKVMTGIRTISCCIHAVAPPPGLGNGLEGSHDFLQVPDLALRAVQAGNILGGRMAGSVAAATRPSPFNHVQ